MSDPSINPFELRLHHRWKFLYVNYHGHRYLMLLAVSTFAGCLAFLLPWFSIVGWSYVPYQETFSPFAAWSVLAGAIWFVLIIGIAMFAFTSRRPLLCIVGFISLVPTVVLLTILAVGSFLLPALIPINWIPAIHRHKFSLGVSGGIGSLLAAGSAIVLLLWFLALLLHSRRIHRRHRTESAPEIVAASSPSIQPDLSGSSPGEGFSEDRPLLPLRDALRKLGILGPTTIGEADPINQSTDVSPRPGSSEPGRP